jgi:uncharacterized protein (TIGR03435 family)
LTLFRESTLLICRHVEPAFGVGKRLSGKRDPSAAPSLFAAIQDLGLKLEARKAPMKVLVVDHAEKLPEN